MIGLQSVGVKSLPNVFTFFPFKPCKLPGNRWKKEQPCRNPCPWQWAVLEISGTHWWRGAALFPGDLTLVINLSHWWDELPSVVYRVWSEIYFSSTSTSFYLTELKVFIHILLTQLSRFLQTLCISNLKLQEGHCDPSDYVSLGSMNSRDRSSDEPVQRSHSGADNFFII